MKKSDKAREAKLWRDYLASPSGETLGALVESYLGLVRWIVHRRFGRAAEASGVTVKDLVQVGSVGLLKAIQRFDTARGLAFGTYATPTIIGEIRHHFRDKGWMLKVPRRLQEDWLKYQKLTESFSGVASNGSLQQRIHESTGWPYDYIALLSRLCQNPLSLDAPIDTGDDRKSSTLENFVAVSDTDVESAPDRLLIEQAMQQLPLRLRRIVFGRYFRHLSQRQVAKALGLSQMHVSRLERRALQKLRDIIEHGYTLNSKKEEADMEPVGLARSSVDGELVKVRQELEATRRRVGELEARLATEVQQRNRAEDELASFKAQRAGQGQARSVAESLLGPLIDRLMSRVDALEEQSRGLLKLCNQCQNDIQNYGTKKTNSLEENMSKVLERLADLEEKFAKADSRGLTNRVLLDRLQRTVRSIQESRQSEVDEELVELLSAPPKEDPQTDDEGASEVRPVEVSEHPAEKSSGMNDLLLQWRERLEIPLCWAYTADDVVAITATYTRWQNTPWLAPLLQRSLFEFVNRLFEEWNERDPSEALEDVLSKFVQEADSPEQPTSRGLKAVARALRAGFKTRGLIVNNQLAWSELSTFASTLPTYAE